LLKEIAARVAHESVKFEGRNSRPQASAGGVQRFRRIRSMRVTMKTARAESQEAVFNFAATTALWRSFENAEDYFRVGGLAGRLLSGCVVRFPVLGWLSSEPPRLF
jgi:hypothetical protein